MMIKEITFLNGIEEKTEKENACECRTSFRKEALDTGLYFAIDAEGNKIAKIWIFQSSYVFHFLINETHITFLNEAGKEGCIELYKDYINLSIDSLPIGCLIVYKVVTKKEDVDLRFPLYDSWADSDNWLNKKIIELDKLISNSITGSKEALGYAYERNICRYLKDAYIDTGENINFLEKEYTDKFWEETI